MNTFKLRNLDANSPFRNFVVLSIAAHIGLVLVFTVKANFFPGKDQIIQQAIRIDMVALPDKAVTRKKRPKPKAKTPPVKKKKTKKPAKKKPNLKKAKSTQKQAIDQLKALSALDDIKDKEEEVKPKEFKGNYLSKGSGLTGIDKLEFDDFYGQLIEHIKAHWDLPQWLSEAELKAQVLIKIDNQGLITQRKLLLSSGNQVFDTRALEAVKKSSPTPLPPRRLVSIIKNQGLVLNFP